MPPTFPSSSFPPPAIATPIEYQGVRFQQADHQSAPEREPGAVYLAAIDPASKTTLWLLKIENVSPGAPLFAFDFPVHLTHISPGPEADELTVQTNSGNHWRINIAERKVIGSDRAALAQPAAPLNAMPWNNAQLTFSDISVGPGADQLTIVDYAGQHYLVDLKARTAIKVGRQGANPNADMFEPPLDPLPPGF